MDHVEELRRRAAELEAEASRIEHAQFEAREAARRQREEERLARIRAETERTLEHYHHGVFRELRAQWAKPKTPHVAPPLPAWILAAAEAGFPRSPYTGAVLQFDNNDLPVQPSCLGHITMTDPTNFQAFTVDVSRLPWRLASPGAWDG